MCTFIERFGCQHFFVKHVQYLQCMHTLSIQKSFVALTYGTPYLSNTLPKLCAEWRQLSIDMYYLSNALKNGMYHMHGTNSLNIITVKYCQSTPPSSVLER